MFIYLFLFVSCAIRESQNQFNHFVLKLGFIPAEEKANSQLV